MAILHRDGTVTHNNVDIVGSWERDPLGRWIGRKKFTRYTIEQVETRKRDLVAWFDGFNNKERS